jgi:hypothetical protein
VKKKEKKNEEREMTKFLYIFLNDFVNEQYSILLLSTIQSPNCFSYSSEVAGSSFCVFTKLPHQNSFLAILVRLLEMLRRSLVYFICTRVASLCTRLPNEIKLLNRKN